MQTHQLVQGSTPWHAHRRNHFNASDAPAMMGVSPYKTRSELIRELATGVGAEVSPATQRIFDDGHRYEALARPLAEAIVGEDLYPVVGTNGKLSASFDGITMLEDTAFEHKSLNDELRTAMVDGCTGADLPMVYQVQMEQQCMVSGADRVLFMASKWDGGTLVEERHCWYSPNPELAARIDLGWEQLEVDVAAYVPEAFAERVTAATQDHLPSPSVQLTGALAVVSNLAPFGTALRAFVDKIPKKPSTDQEFADTEAACKRLKDAEERLQAAEDTALAGMADVETMRRTVAELRDLARTTRLASEKLVKARKEQIRVEEVQRGHAAVAEHLAGLHKRLGGAYINGMQRGDFAAAIKGLKSLDSLRNAIDTEIAAAKIEANQAADRIDANLKAIAAAGAAHLFNDQRTLVLKAPDDLAAVIAQRLAAEQQRVEAERERIRQQEAARLELEAKIKAEADERAAAEAARVVEQKRLDDEAAAQRAAAAEAQAQRAPEPAMALAMPPAAASTSVPVRSEPPAEPGRVVTTGAVCEWLGFGITGAVGFFKSLGIEPQAEGGKGTFWHESDLSAIRDALIVRLANLKAPQ
jgi:putative phage-type endonuclease